MRRMALASGLTLAFSAIAGLSCGVENAQQDMQDSTPSDATSTALAGKTICAKEWGRCNFSGIKNVSYGARNKFVVKKLSNGTNCTNRVFGDPLPGVVKACYLDNESTDNPPTDNPPTDNPPTDNPPTGNPPTGNPNPEATCTVPSEARLADVSKPTTVVGNGTAASCTSQSFVDAVAKGGIITFRCGSAPVTITLNQTAKIFNNKGPEIVIDGGGLVTLSGGGKHRILYMNTCDSNQVWTTSHCQNQDHPRLTVQNLTFINSNSKSETQYDGGGAIYSRGGRLKIINSRFFNNSCAETGQDVGGAAIRAFDQYNGLPVYVVNSTFGGAEGYGNSCANGGGISSIGVSWTIINSLFSHNLATGNGGNPAQPNTSGGGSGGAIYNDGNDMTLSLCGTRIEYNRANAFGSAIFFVTNDHTGDMRIDRSVITNNIGGSWYPKYPQISHHSDTNTTVTNSTIKQ